MWEWKPLGEPPPGSLTDATLQLHHAAQIVASVGLNLLEPRPDDSHPNLGWVDAIGGLAGRIAGDTRPVQAALEMDQLRLLLLDDRGGALRDLDLDGRTLDEAYAWLASSIEAAPQELRRPAYEIPDHPVARSGTFSARPAQAFAEVGRWYHNAHHALEDLTAIEKGSDVRCWPHHFDIGILITLDSGMDPENARSIGVGMTPGDTSHAEPYFYVNPYPSPAHATLPELESGAAWHTRGWTGAVLSASALLEVDASAQRERLDAYLRSALSACHELLGTRTRTAP